MARRALAAYGALCAVVWLTVWSVYRTPSFVALTPSERAAVIARARRGEPTADPTRISVGATFIRR